MEETFIDKLIQKDNVNAVRRLVIGGLLAASAPFGIGAIAGVTLASVAINSAVFSHEKKVQQKKLLNFYSDEIAALQHKPKEALDLDDLKQVGAPRSEGGKGIGALGAELREMETYQKFRLGGSTVSSAITSGILIGISMAFPPFLASGLLTVLGLGLIGFGYTAIAMTVRATSQAIFGNHDPENSVNQRLMRISEEIKEKPVNPIEIFGLFAESNPALKAQIKQNFKAAYADLPVMQKKQVVEAFEPQLRAIALTNAMNNGEIKPSLVGFIASGSECSALPGYDKYQALFDRPPEKISDYSFDIARNVNLSNHRARIEAEREILSSSKAIH